ncbi:hypothetical protein M0804_007823 [Polistes exclamans]|nr:hypothetical protein M0804_007823 [Polistes exclamans]
MILSEHLAKCKQPNGKCKSLDPKGIRILVAFEILSNAAGADSLDGCIGRGSRALQDPRVGSRSRKDKVGNPVDYGCTMLSYGAVKSLPLSPLLYTLSSATLREKYLVFIFHYYPNFDI